MSPERGQLGLHLGVLVQFVNLFGHHSAVFGAQRTRRPVGFVALGRLGGFGTLDAVARRLTFQEILADGAVQVLVGRRRC